MLVLGLNGSLTGTLANEHAPPQLRDEAHHDASAVLLEDGRIIAAIEQERIDRIKHSSKFPADAIKFCLRERGVRLADLDAVAFFISRSAYAWTLRDLALDQASAGAKAIETDPTVLLRATFQRALNDDIPEDRIHFVKHHLAHAASAYWPSGFERALVVTIDGQGERESGTVSVGDGDKLKRIDAFGLEKSLGALYMSVIRVLGFKMFDEYKAMGLAPYGDPSVHRPDLRKLYELGENGAFKLYLERVPMTLGRLVPRAKGQQFTQTHMDIAASLQEALEAIAFHLIEHHLRSTGLRDLCLAGGVAHNCTLNGKLRGSPLVDRLFVQPASHDAGCALGAALVVHRTLAPTTRIAPLEHVYVGSEVEAAADVDARISTWSTFVEGRRSADIIADTAQILADGKIIGWVQGRSEFGPRALGNRSILADARPAENKTVINAMVKKREGFRPFAPAVAIEAARDFFVIPGDADIPYMTFVVNVQPDKRSLLGAITHVDGSARVQTVSRTQNHKFWSLLQAFGERTGVPVLLNTSFNNNAEPIVDSAEDAIVTFLTTDLNLLVIGDLVIQRRAFARNAIAGLRISLPASYYLTEQRQLGVRTTELARTYDRTRLTVSTAAYDLLDRTDGTKRLSDLDASPSEALIEELWSLWERRAIVLRP